MGSVNQGIADRGVAVSLRALRLLASSEMLDKAGIRKQVERALFWASRDGFRSATAISRSFKAAQRLTSPARQAPVTNPTYPTPITEICTSNLSISGLFQISERSQQTQF